MSINIDVESIAVRDPGRAEWNVKRGGYAPGVTIPKFRVIVCTTRDGTIEFTVPPMDAPLVKEFFAPD